MATYFFIKLKYADESPFFGSVVVVVVVEGGGTSKVKYGPLQNKYNNSMKTRVKTKEQQTPGGQ